MPEFEEQYQKASEKAMQLLKIRLHGTAELARKLSLRGFNREVIEKVTADLTESGYLNDQQFTENFLDNLIRYKTFGFFGLKAKLMQRGIVGSEAERLLKEKLPLEAEKEIASRLLKKFEGADKINPVRSKTSLASADAQQHRTSNGIKLAQKLSRKGFRGEVISKILYEI